MGIQIVDVGEPGPPGSPGHQSAPRRWVLIINTNNYGDQSANKTKRIQIRFKSHHNLD